ncbi:MAG: 8-amino-7-oxononanoate synthase [Pseudomonadota bacterium]|nr:8-amino-7-oxononanoate synthase [Pseudomonadota bacterium]
MPRPSLVDRLSQANGERAAAGLSRRLRTVTQTQGMRVQISGHALISFASNDYLGLGQDPRIVSALQSAANEWGVGATAAHLLGGHRGPHQQLEEEIADWLGYPRALLFSTGMMANLGVLATLLKRGDICLQDRLNHASLIDGARLSGADLRRYPHGDVEAAERQLQSKPEAAALLATDGVFSMDGDVAPLPALAALCLREQALLMVDDAHGIGVIGDCGRGSVSAAKLGVADVPLLMVTLGKAIGTFGALVLGEAATIDALIQFARPYIYTTAMPPALAAATLVSVRIAREEDWRRERLRALIDQFRAGAMHRGFALMPSTSAIQPVLIGTAEQATRLSNQLEQYGYYVPAIRPPTVPEYTARLRVTLSAGHAFAEVDGLLDALVLAVKETPLRD